MSDLLGQFVAEARELLEEISSGLLALEEAPEAEGSLDGVFRAAHTLKGSSALFEVRPLTDLVHAAEDLLGQLRQGEAALAPELLDALFAAFDQVEVWVGALEAEGDLPADAAEASRAVIERLRGQAGDGGAPEEPVTEEGAEGSGPSDYWPPDFLQEAYGAAPEDGTLVLVEVRPPAEAFFAGTDPLGLLREVPELVALHLAPMEPWGDAAELDPFSCRLRFWLASTAPRSEVETALAYIRPHCRIETVRPEDSTDYGKGPSDGPADASPSDPDTAAPGSGSAATLRVDQAKIDRLMDLAGELIVATNGLPFLAERAEEGDGQGLARLLKEQHALFDRLVRDLQGEVMQARMLPVAQIFRRFPRMVRDTARSLGKQVRLVTEGEDTQVDKQVLEQLGDPLLHVVRNSLDHGIEPPEERRAAGKEPEGTIHVAASRSDDRIVIRVEDDGRGIDPERVRAKAVERGVIDSAEAATLDEEGAAGLLFRAGFSTAEEVTAVSGRGVGMDTVRAMAEANGGSVSLEGRPGRGARLWLALPLSMAVTRVLMVKARGQAFGVPFTQVVETLRVSPDRVHGIKHRRALAWRERFVPLIDLGERLGGESGQIEEGAAVLVVRLARGEVAFLVDDFSGGTDVVVKPLAGLLKGAPGVTGTGVLGDGSVLLVLALEDLA